MTRSARYAAARRVTDRFAAADGGLLAAGVAYNAVFALIPVALLATGLAGLLLTDPQRRADVVLAIAAALPPLTPVVDEIVGGLSKASPSVSIVGLVLAGWGTSRLFSALESAIVQLDMQGPPRSLARRTARRLGAIAVLAGVVIAAVLLAPALAVAAEMSGATGPARQLFDLLLAFLPPLLVAGALTAIYRVVPRARPSWRAIRLPVVAGTIALVLLTRVFVFVAPRLFGSNLIYGTLGAILVSLTWLDLAFTVVLIGAAWVRERATLSEAVVV